MGGLAAITVHRALERVRGGGPQAALDMAELRVTGGEVEGVPFLEAEPHLAVAHRRHLCGAAIDEPEPASYRVQRIRSRARISMSRYGTPPPRPRGPRSGWAPTRRAAYPRLQGSPSCCRDRRGRHTARRSCRPQGAFRGGGTRPRRPACSSRRASSRRLCTRARRPFDGRGSAVYRSVAHQALASS